MASRWATVSLSEVATVNPDARDRSWPFPHIRYVDISSVGTGFLHEQPRLIAVEEAPSRATRLVTNQDTVLSTVRPNRRSMFFVREPESDWVVSTGFAVVRARPGAIDPRYLYWCIYSQSFTDYLVSRERGAAYPAVSVEDIQDAEIPLPPIEVQRAIGSRLGALDDKIELNRRVSETLEGIARTLFKSWFVDFDPVRAKAEREDPGLPGPIARLFPDSFEASSMGEIPTGWTEASLGELTEKPQYGFTASASDDPIGPKFLRITDINKTPWIDWQDVPYCDADVSDREKYLLREGDVVIARMADPGHGAFIEAGPEAVFASYLIRFRPVDHRFGRFLQYWLRSSTYWDLVRGRGAGTTRSTLNATTLSRFPLVVPPVEVASEFARRVELLRDRLVLGIDENGTLSRIRDSLLPKLMAGDLPLSDSRTGSVEVAS